MAWEPFLGRSTLQLCRHLYRTYVFALLGFRYDALVDWRFHGNGYVSQRGRRWCEDLLS